MVRLGKCKARCKCNMRLQEQRSDKSERVEEKKKLHAANIQKRNIKGQKRSIDQSTQQR